jgi:hypothetical protein
VNSDIRPNRKIRFCFEGSSYRFVNKLHEMNANATNGCEIPINSSAPGPYLHSLNLNIEVELFEIETARPVK